jgi:hypothetical protein
VGNYTLVLYENIANKFKIGTIIYMRDIYTETTIAIARILNIAGNTITLQNLYSNFVDIYTVLGMDNIEIYKIKSFENYNLIQNRSSFLLDLINRNLLTLSELIFEDEDYLILNSFG